MTTYDTGFWIGYFLGTVLLYGGAIILILGFAWLFLRVLRGLKNELKKETPRDEKTY